MDEHRSISLLKFMTEGGLVPSPEETFRRDSIIHKLKKIIQTWITKIAWQRNLPENVIRDASAAILTYGSFGLGVHNSESDIDVLCVGPRFATLAEDFCIVLYNILRSKSEVSEIHVKDAKVPLVRFKFEGVSVNMPYAQLQAFSIPENVDLLNPTILAGIDETSWQSLSDVRVNQRILQLVPNLENFQSLLRCIKFWAKRRGVYGNLFGFLGGIHLAILSSFICQTNADACLSALVMNFFSTFASWPWPTPVVLQDGMMQFVNDVIEIKTWMPIRLPCSPYRCCQSNVTRSTFNRIRAEFLRGHKLTQGILQPDFDWDNLLEPYDNVYQKLYSRFLKIYLSACAEDDLGDWVGWVKSRFPSLILKLEEIRVTFDPNPAEYVDSGNVNYKPNVAFYWGLNMVRCMDVNLTSLEEDFRNSLTNGYHGMPGKMELSIVPASELPDIRQYPTQKMKGMKACWRIHEYDRLRKPVYSRHLPNYFIGYVATIQ